MSRHTHGCPDDALGEAESLLLIGGVLWITLASLRWLLQRPKLWPLVALACWGIARSTPDIPSREEMTAGEPFHTLHACGRALGRWIPMDSVTNRGPDYVSIRLVGVPRPGLVTWCGSTNGVMDGIDTSVVPSGVPPVADSTPARGGRVRSR